MYLGLGTNLGDRAAQLRTALRAIAGIVRVDAVSPVYASAPIGFAEQPDFWNLVVRARTAIAPAPLLTALKEAEAALGRKPSFRNGPREIDIDILLYGDVVHAMAPVVPHPRMHTRAFVLQPLADLDAELRDPRDDTRWADHLAELSAQRIERVANGTALLGKREGT